MDFPLLASADQPPELTAGVDEAGRGALAGPVVAAAVILSPKYDLPGLDDSKKLKPAQRAELAVLIKECAVAYGVGIVQAPEIDKVNILQATFKAMAQAVEKLAPAPEYVLVDGNKTIPGLNFRQQAVVKGDSLFPMISAASIIAKTHRDAIMAGLDQKYPGYGFARHMGYGTKIHVTALKTHGPCPEHRLTFKKVLPEPEEKEAQSWLPGI